MGWRKDGRFRLVRTLLLTVFLPDDRPVPLPRSPTYIVSVLTRSEITCHSARRAYRENTLQDHSLLGK